MSADTTKPPVIAFVGASGAGKTTLLERLIRELRHQGFRVGTVKHHARDFEMDRPGKDSWRHKTAGASVSVISGPRKIGLVMDADHDHRLEELMPFFTGVDVVIAEGYKREDHPKIEVFRGSSGDGPLCLDDNRLMAVVSDAPLNPAFPSFATDDIEGLAAFLIARLHLVPPPAAQPVEAAPRRPADCS